MFNGDFNESVHNSTFRLIKFDSKRLDFKGWQF